MKLIESSVQIIEEKDPYKMIELADELKSLMNVKNIELNSVK